MNKNTSKNTPALRFPEFNEEWSVKRFHHFDIKVIDGDRGDNYPKSSDFLKDGFCLFLNAKNVTKRGFCFDNVSFISKDKDADMRKGKLNIDDIVLTTRGSVGNIALYDSGVKYSNLRINSGMVIIRSSKEHILPKYLYFCLNSKNIELQINRIKFGSAQPQLTVEGINKILLGAPSNKKEQEKIADFLGIVDERIEKLSKMNGLLEQYKKGLMQQIFSQGLRFKDDNGNPFPDWTYIKLLKICSIKKGEQLNRSTLFDTGQYPAINGGIEPSGYTDKYNSLENTITISEGGNSCGFVNFIKQKFWSGGHCYSLLDIKINHIFFFYKLKHIEPLIMSLRVGSSLPNIQKKDLEKLSFKMSMDVKEQQKIADFLSLIDKKIELVSIQLEKMQEFKKGLLQQMFI